MNVETWLWVGTIGMLFGMAALFFPLFRNKDVSDQGDLIAHFYVPMIAFTLYLLMTLGAGAMTTSNGRVFYFGRYVDWTFTTPLLLYSLVSSGLKDTNIKRPALLMGLLGADIYMIFTGFVAGVTDNMTVKWSFYISSCISFIAIYGLLFGPFRRLTATGPNGKDFVKKASVLSLLWLAYPIVFIMGQEGVRIWSANTDAALYTILDLVAKVAYGLWAVSLAGKVQSATAGFSTPVRATAR